MRKFAVVLAAVILFGSIRLHAQDKAFVRETIIKLSSPEFHGRGYVKNGDRLASEFIASEAAKAGLVPAGKNFYQEYSIPVNAFPGKILCKVGDQDLLPGVDYLIHPSSCSFKGTHKIAWINKKVVEHGDALINMLSNDLDDYFIAIDTAGINNEMVDDLIKFIKEEKPTKAKGIIEIIEGNLTYRISPVRKNFPYIQIKKGKLTPEDETVTVRIESKFYKNYKTRNVIGILPGETDTTIVFTAHYDHLGRMGKDTYFPGGNDNASGSAMLLDLARHLKKTDNLRYTYVFMWFAGEEAGLTGSRYYVEHPFLPLEKIKYLFNLDMVGTGETGIRIVNGAFFPDVMERILHLNEVHQFLSSVTPRETSANSDHHPFFEKGVRAFFIFTTGEYRHYHNIYDRGEDVPLSAYDSFFGLIRTFLMDVEVLHY
jgi:hypothetical protein